MSASVATPSVRSVCVCRSPRTSCSVTRSGSSPRSAAATSPVCSRSGGEIQGIPRSRYTSSSVCETIFSPVTALNRPYSDSLSFFRTAISRTATLCACDPVKYCNAAPQESSGITRRSTCRPAAVRIEVLVGPEAITEAASGMPVSAAINGPESSAAARMSTSPMVSANRRSEPAGAHRWHPETAPITSTTRAAVSSATFSRTRPPAASSSSMPRSSFSSLLLPKPRRPASRPALIASRSSSGEPTWSSRYSSRARFGPSAGILVSWSTPSGICARSPSSSAKVPVSPISATFLAMALPTPGICCSRSGPSWDTSSARPAIERAAFSYDRARNWSPPVIRCSSAYSLSSAVTASLARGMFHPPRPRPPAPATPTPGAALALGRLEGQRYRVDAPPLVGGHLVALALEYVAQVRVARGARDLGADVAERAVLEHHDRVVFGWLVEAGPPAVRIELGVRAEQLGTARAAPVDALGLGVGVLALERRLRARLPQHAVLLGRELLAPFLVGPLNLVHAAETTRARQIVTSWTGSPAAASRSSTSATVPAARTSASTSASAASCGAGAVTASRCTLARIGSLAWDFALRIAPIAADAASSRAIVEKAPETVIRQVGADMTVGQENITWEELERHLGTNDEEWIDIHNITEEGVL